MSADRRLLPFALVGGIGLTLAVLQFVLDDRDPLVFTIPILVLTGVILGVLALSGRGAPARGWSAEDREGLDDDGVRPLPAVTPILAGVRAPTRVLSGQLYPGGPWVRIARVRSEVVAITDAPAGDVDEEARAWLAERGRRAFVDEGLLVVAAPQDTTPRELLGVTRELHARL